MRRLRRSLTASVLLVVVVVAWTGPLASSARADTPAGRSEAPVGQITIAATVSIAPRWFDPAESEGYSGLGGTCTHASGQVGVVG